MIPPKHTHTFPFFDDNVRMWRKKETAATPSLIIGVKKVKKKRLVPHALASFLSSALLLRSVVRRSKSLLFLS
jgi:hypothetical protein